MTLHLHRATLRQTFFWERRRETVLYWALSTAALGMSLLRTGWHAQACPRDAPVGAGALEGWLCCASSPLTEVLVVCPCMSTVPAAAWSVPVPWTSLTWVARQLKTISKWGTHTTTAPDPPRQGQLCRPPLAPLSPPGPCKRLSGSDLRNWPKNGIFILCINLGKSCGHSQYVTNL